LANAYKDAYVKLIVNCSFQNFQKLLIDNFTEKNYEKDKIAKKPPSDNLILAMFDRFRPFKLVGGVRDNSFVNYEKDIDMLDFIISLNLLAR
jgi:hypothetical protein